MTSSATHPSADERLPGTHIGPHSSTPQALESHQPLWEQLEDLDSHTQLQDPATALSKPYSHCSRCIALGNGASCQVKLSPAAPRALPSSVVFHGPSSVVAGLQNAWYSSAHRVWQEQLSVRENLQAVLQVGGLLVLWVLLTAMVTQQRFCPLQQYTAARHHTEAHGLPVPLVSSAHSAPALNLLHG